MMLHYCTLPRKKTQLRAKLKYVKAGYLLAVEV